MNFGKNQSMFPFIIQSNIKKYVLGSIYKMGENDDESPLSSFCPIVMEHESA